MEEHSCAFSVKSLCKGTKLCCVAGTYGKRGFSALYTMISPLKKSLRMKVLM